MTRIHVTGASGSGTTTLGRALAAVAAAPHFETDDYLWEPTDPPFQRRRFFGDSARLLERDLGPLPQWVLSGSIAGWSSPVAARLELAVLVVVPTEVRLARIEQREVERYGAEALRAGGSRHERHRSFVEWTSAYDDGPETVRSRRLHEAFLGKLACPVLRVDGTRPVAALVEEVVAAGGR